MRPIWKGSINFGLVNIPITLFPATRREELSFHLLRAADLSRVNNKRVAEADGKEVKWADLVKGYEYEKGKFVVIKDEDFRRVDVEATQTVNIVSFVKLEEVNPVFFHKPYYMEPSKGGDKAYVLLREALKVTGRIGIAKVVIKTREYLAAVKPQDSGMMLELMHFEDELIDLDEYKAPTAKTAAKKELDMAKSLIDSMTEKWNPEDYKDEYRERLEEMIEKKVASGGKEGPSKEPAKTRGSGKVIDLFAVLQQSIKQASGNKPAKAAKEIPAAKAKKKAAPAAKSKAKPKRKSA